jgi:penicillin-insensitive murein endopeptidase
MKNIIGLATLLLFVSCKQTDCEKVDTSKLSASQLSEHKAQCGDTSTDDDRDPGQTQAVGYYSDGGMLINAEDVLNRSNSIHKIFMNRDRPYGTRELIDLVIDMADEVQARYDNVEKLQVGDLANRHGGPALPNHQSHQNGLDVDIVYLSNDHKLQGKNNAYWTQYFVSKGKVTSNFNTSRNWELFKYIVDQADVGRIFVDPAIKSRMCSYAKSIGEFSDNIEVLRRLRPLNQHHETHFHLRLKCPDDDPDCIDQAEPPSGSGC